MTTSVAETEKLTREKRIHEILAKVRELAIEYYNITGKPLGVTGEIGENEAAARLGWTLSEARTAGYDAIDASNRRIQIKTRWIPRNKKIVGQRTGKINLKHEWDDVLLVLLDEIFEVRGMYLAGRDAIEAALTRTDSRARKRGTLAVAEFIRLAKEAMP